MGIQGLLPFLRDVQREVNLKDYKGCTVAVDAYCWLHKGAFACAEKLAVGEKTDQYVYYCMKFVNAMLSWDIKPVLVFDGCHLPSKKEVERTRRERRDAYRKKAAQFLREGKKSEARQCLERCIDITPQMALELMKACREKGVDCIVAPYEADSQLAYLNKIGVAQIIITEDSDLLLFGCERVLYKLDVNGNGIMIEKERLGEAASLKNSFCTFEKFRHMCILSGCDYLPSLRGIGLGNAAKIIKKAKNPDMTKVLRKLSTYLKNAPEVPQEYIDGFTQAENTFLYQVVFDPLQRHLVPLNPFPDGMNPKDLEYAGAYFCNGRAYQIALGNINIYNGERMDDYDPDTYKPPPQKVKMWEQNTGKRSGMLHRLSIWDKNFRANSSVSTLKTEPSRTERLSTAGIEVQVKTIRIDNLRQNHGKRKREEEDLEKNDITLAEEYGYKKSQEKKRRSDDLLCLPETQKEEISTKENLYDSNVQELADVSNNKESSKIVGAEEVDAISPRRKNVFGTVLPKKEKFNINAAKPVVETHSRFFTKSTAPKLKNKRESVFDHFELQQGIDKDTTTSTNSNPKADIINTASYVKDCKNSVQEKLNINQEIKTTLQTNTIVEMESNADSQEAKVRKSSFMWNKFSSSFSSRPKENDVKHVPLSSSQASLSQFKAVKMSEKSINDAQVVNSEEIILGEKSDSSEIDSLSQTSEKIGPLSLFYSLDTITDSQGQPGLSQSQLLSSQTSNTASDWSEKSGFGERDLSQEAKDPTVTEVLGLIQDEDDISASLAANSQSSVSSESKLKSQSCRSVGLCSSVSSTPKSGSVSKLIGKARRSGLSKTTTKGKKTNNENAQTTISRYFQKFENKKKSGVDKLDPLIKPTAISPNKDNIQPDRTPETDTLTAKHDGAKVQRKILLA